MRRDARTPGTCTRNCSALPTTAAHATITARRGRSTPPPNAIRAAIIAAFQAIGAV
jgi:hypothetical protein